MHDRVAQRAGERGDRGADAEHAAVLVEHRGPFPRREQGQPLGDLGAVDRSRRDAGLAQDREPPLGGRAEHHDAVARQQFTPELRLPLPPQAARLAGDGHEAGIVVRVPEDPRLAAGLAVARHAALVDGDRGAALGQRMGGREPDDARADDPDVAHVVKPRISCAVSSGTSSWGQWPTPSSSTQSACGSQSLR